MTKPELLKLLKKLQRLASFEEAHIYADSALLDYINDEEIADAYSKIHKWYC